MADDLTHFDPDGRPRMVDVSAKPESDRFAAARGYVRMDEATLALARSGGGAKGDVRRIAELAGTMAAKRTGDLIPLCHPLPLTAVAVTVEPDESLPGLAVTAEVRTTGRTGVEMEALTAAAIAALTMYDMAKSLQRDIVIERVRLLEKSGGRSGDYRADP